MSPPIVVEVPTAFFRLSSAGRNLRSPSSAAASTIRLPTFGDSEPAEDRFRTIVGSLRRASPTSASPAGVPFGSSIRAASGAVEHLVARDVQHRAERAGSPSPASGIAVGTQLDERVDGARGRWVAGDERQRGSHRASDFRAPHLACAPGRCRAHVLAEVTERVDASLDRCCGRLGIALREASRMSGRLWSRHGWFSRSQADPGRRARRSAGGRSDATSRPRGEGFGIATAVQLAHGLPVFVVVQLLVRDRRRESSRHDAALSPSGMTEGLAL